MGTDELGRWFPDEEDLTFLNEALYFNQNNSFSYDEASVYLGISIQQLKLLIEHEEVLALPTEQGRIIPSWQFDNERKPTPKLQELISRVPYKLRDSRHWILAEVLTRKRNGISIVEGLQKEDPRAFQAALDGIEMLWADV